MTKLMNRNKLVEEYRRIAQNHQDAILLRVARIILGPSVIRVFRSGTKEDLIPVLVAMKVDELKHMRQETEFVEWFHQQLDQVALAIRKKNKDNPRVNPGYKWGHAAKILTLFIRDLVHCSCYLNSSTIKRVNPWLFNPVDGIVIKRLRHLDCRLPVRTIKEINSRRKFDTIQDLLGLAARQAKVPRVWFDDIWGDRQ